MLGNERHELSRDDFAKYLGLSQGGARVHSLACPNPNGSREEDHLPPLESIRHLYKNPDAVVVEHFGQHLKRYPNLDSKRRLKKPVKSPASNMASLCVVCAPLRAICLSAWRPRAILHV
jgi:hypothetical protein